ncbi:MAG: TIGR04282 family arsenosugar biosynthesis glycosyltransferase [Gracilimonas sp.]
MSHNKLIVFVKNEEAGKVKTRLANTVGDDKALEIYRKLLGYTFDQVNSLEVTKEVWYSRFIEQEDVWSEGDFKKHVQEGVNLGERMSGAFRKSFEEEGVEKAVIIGSDCAELTTVILEEAFSRLDKNDIVIGPAEDGGYYLIGMSRFFPELFKDIAWSTESVLEKTIQKATQMGASHFLLKELNDVDEIGDWKRVEDKLH